MKELKNSMTISQLVEVAGCTEKTVRTAIKELLPNKMKRGVQTRLNDEESMAIMRKLPKRNMVSMPDNQGTPKTNTGQLIAVVTDLVQQNRVLLEILVQKNSLDTRSYNPSQITEDVEKEASHTKPKERVERVITGSRDELHSLVKAGALKHNVHYADVYSNYVYKKMSVNTKEEANKAGCSQISWVEKNGYLSEAIPLAKEFLEKDSLEKGW